MGVFRDLRQPEVNAVLFRKILFQQKVRERFLWAFGPRRGTA